MRKSLSILVCAILLITQAMLTAGCKTVVSKAFTFQDPALEYAVREYLKKPSGAILHSDIENLRIFAMQPDKIQINGATVIPLPSDLTFRTLADLPGFPNAGSVILGEGAFEAIEVLAECQKLQRVSLYKITDLSNIEFLTSLPRLVTLQLHTNSSLKDFSPLAQIPTLRELDLHNSGITDISMLSGLAELRKLSLHNNRITDISALAGCTKLTDLDLHTNMIESIEALAGLENLKTLRLEVNLISNLSPLSAKKELRTLALDYNKVTSVTALEHLPALRSLSLKKNPGLGAMQMVDLRKTLHEDCKIEWS